MTSIISCPVCNCTGLRVFFELLNVPANCNYLWQSRKGAQKCTKGDIQLAFCPTCGLITNLAFNPEILTYDHHYENSLFHSPHFQEFSRLLAIRLVERFDLYNKKILQIGYGKSKFLFLLCELGNNKGLNFDTTHKISDVPYKEEGRIKFISDLYSEYTRDYKPDFIFSWHLLEHIYNPGKFLKNLRQLIGKNQSTYLYFSLGNGLHNFHKLFILDIIYEHCSYFTPSSLAYLFKSCGFQVCEIQIQHEGQSLCITALPDNKIIANRYRINPFDVKLIANEIISFEINYIKKVKKYRDMMKQFSVQGKRIVIWGAGSRGVTFLNTLKDIQIEYAVDINPRKQGMYIPGTGQKIVPSEFLKEYKPDIIIIMNAIYQLEIEHKTKNLGLKTKILTV